MTDLPKLALSVRQPWAWAIFFAGKDIENRSGFALKHMNFEDVDRIAIHASKQMTRSDYQAADLFMRSIGIVCPQPWQLLRGGVIGSVAVKGIANLSASRWFFGPKGIRLADPEPCDFIPCTGALGLFNWRGMPVGKDAAEPDKWMLRAPVPAAAPEQEGLL
jgi:hypothetical protein